MFRAFVGSKVKIKQNANYSNVSVLNTKKTVISNSISTIFNAKLLSSGSVRSTNEPADVLVIKYS